MEYSKKFGLGFPVSFVLCPVDDYTGEWVSEGSIKLYYPYFCKAPIYKPDGTIIFCSLPEGEYRFRLLSKDYLDEEIMVQLPIQKNINLTIHKSLKPRPSYRFPGGATLVRLAAAYKNGSPASGATIRCEIKSDDFSIAKIAKSAIAKGDTGFYVSSVTGKISIEDCYLVKMGEEIAEECVIAEQIEESRYLRVKTPFNEHHSRGSALIPIIKTQTDEKGEAVIYFRSPPAKKFDVIINIESNEKRFNREIRVEEGRTSYLGCINI